ncbi:MAG: phosphatidylserine decarboxylase family protein [Ignavibacteria bacterium]|nr:phosphatidylserine decarboxylase family protein [Ignavibacteria bacterium]MBL7991295.1 phosphatidylserine decarboxylase family protein [Candidatus Kapabacteria bacterium]
MITRYGYDNFLALIAGGFALMTFGLWSDIPVLKWLLIAFGGLVCFFALWFFRNPTRTVPQEALSDDAVVIAPADGKVVQIITLEEPRLIKGKAERISIFLSPLDVHVNRVPANGEIVFSEYRRGKFLVAMDHRASEENEQTIIGLKNNKGVLIFKQMTGALARRIVNEAKPGDRFKAGDEFGMMKFGSRMDVIVPEGTHILVREGERVVGGETVLCRLQ